MIDPYNAVDPEEEIPIDAGGGNSMIVDYRGAIVGKQLYNVERLRNPRSGTIRNKTPGGRRGTYEFFAD